MQKLNFFVIVAIMATCIAANAQDNRLTTSVKGGVALFLPSVENDDLDPLEGTGFGFEAGLIFEPGSSKGLSFETSLFFGSSDLALEEDEDAESSLNSAALFGDVKYDFLSSLHQSSVSLIGGVGIGVAYNDLGEFTYTGQQTLTDGDAVTSFAYRVSLTARYNVNKQLGLYCSYQYQDLGTAESGDVGLFGPTEPLEFDLTAHVVGIGVDYKF